MTDRVAVEPIREAVAASELSINEIARRCGRVRRSYTNKTGKYKYTRKEPYVCGDGAWLKRIIGVMPNRSKHKDTQYNSFQTTMKYEQAVAIIRACDFDPVDWGL